MAIEKKKEKKKKEERKKARKLASKSGKQVVRAGPGRTEKKEKKRRKEKIQRLFLVSLVSSFLFASRPSLS